MIPAPIRLRALGVCLVAMSCLGGCGGDVAQAPGTHLILPDDVAARTDGAPGTDTVDVGPESDTETVCEVRDGCAPPSDVPGQDLDAGFSCTPAERTCDGATVMECATDGQGLTYVEECDDDDPCTEDQCLAGECLYEHAGACCEPPCPMGQLCFDGAVLRQGMRRRRLRRELRRMPGAASLLARGPLPLRSRVQPPGRDGAGVRR